MRRLQVNNLLQVPSVNTFLNAMRYSLTYLHLISVVESFFVFKPRFIIK